MEKKKYCLGFNEDELIIHDINDIVKVDDVKSISFHIRFNSDAPKEEDLRIPNGVYVTDWSKECKIEIHKKYQSDIYPDEREIYLISVYITNKWREMIKQFTSCIEMQKPYDIKDFCSKIACYVYNKKMEDIEYCNHFYCVPKD